MTGLALVLLLLWQSASVAPTLPTLSDDDVEVINTVIAMTVQPVHQRFQASATRDILMIDRTAPMCVPNVTPARSPGCIGPLDFYRLDKPQGSGRRRFEQHLKPAVAAALTAAFIRANERSAVVPVDKIAGIRFVAPADWDRSKPTAKISRPGYAGENRALVYATYSCGGGCGHGWLVLLERKSGAWRVLQSDMVWIA